VNIDLVTIVVDEYDPAIHFFVHSLGFDLLEDSPALTESGEPKRWVVVRPPGAETGVLLARADDEHQASVIGSQTDRRVAFFLRVDDFDTSYRRMTAAGVRFIRSPRSEPYGQVAVFLDCVGNRWVSSDPSRRPAWRRQRSAPSAAPDCPRPPSPGQLDVRGPHSLRHSRTVGSF
jgi:catechol 2,3-dioxygenase-like lactoylglutathione lyase family enzyme